MARTGVTQEAVNAAADRLLETGERPTIERVRAALGTGSPNTLIRLLDVWWADLGQRLRTQAAKIALPEAPASVAAVASKLWEHALESAQNHAEQALTLEREQLRRDREALDREHEALKVQTEALTTQVSEAQHSEQVAQSRLTETARLVDQQAIQLSDLGHQRDTAQQRADRLEQELAELRARLDDQQASIAIERERHIEYVTALENRTAAEVDRSRQETRTLRDDLAAKQREHAREFNAAKQQRDEAWSALAAAKQDAMAQRARADALEAQHAQLSTLAATVEKALSQTRSRPSTSRKRARTQKPRSVPPG